MLKPTYYKRLVYFCMILLFPISISAQGLKIKGNESLINERTSYSVFDNESPEFVDILNISFDISFLEAAQLGYILRIKNEEENTIYNLSVDQGGKQFVIFKFNEEGRSNLIDVSLNKKQLEESYWIKIHIQFDLTKSVLKLVINNETFSFENLNLPGRWTPSIFFGKSEHVIDVPSFAIRNLVIGDNKTRYNFPLNESGGENVHSSKGKTIGHVTNPIWLINNAYYWKHRITLKSGTVAGANLNTETQEMYYFNKDSITIYNVQTEGFHSQKYLNKCPINIVLGTNFIDYVNKRLVVYEVHENQSLNVTSIAYLDLTDYRWHSTSKEQLPTQLHHHAEYYNAKRNSYTIFGGFGNMKYNKSFYVLDLETYKWEESIFTGDKIDPRYFTSMGYLNETNSLYIFGGMGNESGDQVVGRRYCYDLYQVDLSSNQITKKWEISWAADNMVPVRKMICNDSSFYTLCYPEHFSDSFLNLYKFSIEDGSYTILGDSIPIHSEKIKTNANLYYTNRLNELYALVQEFDDDDIASDLKVYSLSFPPITLRSLSEYTESGQENEFNKGVLLTIVLVLAIAILCLIKKKTKRKDNGVMDSKTRMSKEILPIAQNKDNANSIYLFGEFTVRNKHNKDVTYMFSTKLKYAFLLILQYSMKDGISSQQLSEILWPNKPEDKVKNSRGVTLNHLRKILSELDNINLVHEKGVFRIAISDNCYCDCMRCFEIINSGKMGEKNIEFAEILKRGKFLKSIDNEMFDSFKEIVEGKIEPTLLVEMDNYYRQENYQSSILLAEAMFNIDPINESAIHYLLHSMLELNMTEEAKRRHVSFVSEYRMTMGEDYHKSFSDFGE